MELVSTIQQRMQCLCGPGAKLDGMYDYLIDTAAINQIAGTCYLMPFSCADYLCVLFHLYYPSIMAPRTH
uniref:Uncharacterized protein n=1 Tax=Rhizophora mucronata TaxID=61149 RepID=A0A2P2PMX3_RHIMU